MYADPRQITGDIASLLRPPRRLTVPEASEKFVILDTPGGYSGPWRNPLVHYLVKPANCLTSRKYTAVIFVGPAQTGKTNMLVDNWTAHTIMCDPADHMVVQTAKDTARDFSKRRTDRMISSSPEIKEKLRHGGSNDNTHDKFFKSGMILSLGWPTKNQLSGKAIGKMALTDYDRMPENIDGVTAFWLAHKRTTTFLSRGMTLAESSPSREIIDSKWEKNRKTKHQAPPTNGILGLYNYGDRNRLYGQCPSCKEYFFPEADITLSMFIPAIDDNEKAAKEAGLICTKCGDVISQHHENEFKKSGVWVEDGQKINKNGVISGKYLDVDIASFWMPGWFAAFQSWKSITLKYLLARDHFDSTGDEDAIRATYNLDQGAPYLSKARENTRDESQLERRAEPLEKRTVPDGVNFLLAQIDVQKGRFVVQVEGFGEYLESWIVDRFNLRLSHRDDEHGKSLPLNPASYSEDWEVITNNVIKKTYPRENGKGSLPILLTACDSGGEDGVTQNAYNYWLLLQSKGLASRQLNRTKFILVKGGSSRAAQMVKESFPDTTKRADRKVKISGEVPVFILNTMLFKDAVSNDLERPDPGPKYVHFPSWLNSAFYAELMTEVRTPKGWVNEPKKPNESFDLMCYARVLLKLIKADKINWSKPPSWASTGIVTVRKKQDSKKSSSSWVKSENKWIR